MSITDPQDSPESVLRLHRVRFYDHTPSPITCLGFTPLPLPSPSPSPSNGTSGKGKARQIEGDRIKGMGNLIVARENGEVEVWSWVEPEGKMNGNWALDKVLPPTLTHPGISMMAIVLRDPANFGAKGYDIPTLEDLRLFTASSDGSDLVERCLLSGRVLHAYPIPSAPAWSLSVSPSHTLLVLSTTSPNLHFMTIPPNGPLEPPPPHLLRSDGLPSKTRTVSIAWGPPKSMEVEGEWELKDTYLVTGNSDSSFRKWDISPPEVEGRGNGRVSLRGRAVVEKLGKARNGKYQPNSRTIVWGVGVLPDHTIVTSDSLGSVTFWDGASLAQKKSFPAHKADGMCLVVGPGGRTVYSSGPDQRICQFALTKTGPSEEWMMTSAKRYHQHDVRSLAIYPPYSPLPSSTLPRIAPILASGGWDMTPVLSAAATPDMLHPNPLLNPLGRAGKSRQVLFEDAMPRKLSYLGGPRGNERISIARSARLVVGRRERGIAIWRLRGDEQGWEKVAEMDLRLRTHLVSTAISDDGRWLAVSDLFETKLFFLESTPSGEIQPRRIKSLIDTLVESPLLSHLDLSNNGCGSSSLLFTPDGGRLVLGLAASSQVVVLSLSAPVDDSMDVEGESEVEITVEKCFHREETGVSGRVTKGAKSLPNGHPKINGHQKLVNGHAKTNGTTPHEDAENDSQSGSDDDEDDASIERASSTANRPWISTLAASTDSQWLSVADLSGKVSIYNLDTLQLHAILPTFPTPPMTLLFPPASPSLMCIVHPSNSLQFYHLDHRRLLPLVPQLLSLQDRLRDQYQGIQGASFEPLPSASVYSMLDADSARVDPKNAKVVLWGWDFIATARLDLDIISGRVPSISGGNRKKRAREAMEARERVSAGTPSSIDETPAGSVSMSQSSGMSTKGRSSADDPEFVKVINGKFRCIASADWIGWGEMMVVERPLGEFMDELPKAYNVGSFGRG